MTEGTINKELVEYAYNNLKNVPKGTEYEKMILSLPYDCFTDALLMARNLSHESAIDYADIRLKNYNFDIKKHQHARYEHLSKIFGKVDESVFIEPPFFVDYGCNVSLGKNFYANFNTVFLDCTIIKFGDNVLIGPNVTFTAATHPTDPQQRLDAVEYALPITVGNNVWFGANAVVLPGVTIGDGAVVAAGCVVNKDVPENAVVAGVPMRVIRIEKAPVKKQ